MKPLVNRTGITIRQLKELVKDLPETDDAGIDYELWIENTEYEDHTNIAKTIMQLNRGDLIVSHRTSEPDETNT